MKQKRIFNLRQDEKEGRVLREKRRENEESFTAETKKYFRKI